MCSSQYRREHALEAGLYAWKERREKNKFPFIGGREAEGLAFSKDPEHDVAGADFTLH